MDSIIFNTQNTKFVEGDFIGNDDFADKICEVGSFTVTDQWMSFECNEAYINVNYIISVSGSLSYDNGDYWTPPSHDVDIDSVDISITSVTIDDYLVELNDELEKIFQNLVQKYII